MTNLTDAKNIPELTRWREIDDPISIYDQIQEGQSKFEKGKIPHGHYLFLWDSNRIMSGPMLFDNADLAEGYRLTHPDCIEFLVIPKPTNA